MSWCLDATGPTAGLLSGQQVVSEPNPKAPGMAAMVPASAHLNLIFTTAQSLAFWVIERDNVRKAAAAAIEAIRTGMQTLSSPGGGEIWRSYYYAGGQRVAMREQDGNGPTTDEVFFLFGDHLGSTSVIADASGDKVSEMRYLPWGEVRYAWFDSGELEGIPTDFTFTGQRDFTSGFGLMDYGARFYDPSLGRFVQADSIVPELGNPAAFDRFAYVFSNPMKYVDPSGHLAECALLGNPEDIRACGDTKALRLKPHQLYLQEGGFEFKFPRVDIPDDILELIAVVVFAETNGAYPDWATALIIWVFLNRYSADSTGAAIISIYTGALGVLKNNLWKNWGVKIEATDQPGIAREILAYYKNKSSPAFERILAMVKKIYTEKWKAGMPDPTGGALFFSVSSSLERKNAAGVVVVSWNNHDEMRDWLVNNFHQHSQSHPEFAYLITEPFPWNKAGNLGVLVLGNDSVCVPVSNCGAD